MKKLRYLIAVFFVAVLPSVMHAQADPAIEQQKKKKPASSAKHDSKAPQPKLETSKTIPGGVNSSNTVEESYNNSNKELPPNATVVKEEKKTDAGNKPALKKEVTAQDLPDVPASLNKRKSTNELPVPGYTKPENGYDLAPKPTRKAENAANGKPGYTEGPPEKPGYTEGPPEITNKPGYTNGPAEKPGYTTGPPEKNLNAAEVKNINDKPGYTIPGSKPKAQNNTATSTAAEALEKKQTANELPNVPASLNRKTSTNVLPVPGYTNVPPNNNAAEKNVPASNTNKSSGTSTNNLNTYGTLESYPPTTEIQKPENTKAAENSGKQLNRTTTNYGTLQSDEALEKQKKEATENAGNKQLNRTTTNYGTLQSDEALEKQKKEAAGNTPANKNVPQYDKVPPLEDGYSKVEPPRPALNRTTAVKDGLSDKVAEEAKKKENAAKVPQGKSIYGGLPQEPNVNNNAALTKEKEMIEVRTYQGTGALVKEKEMAETKAAQSEVNKNKTLNTKEKQELEKLEKDKIARDEKARLEKAKIEKDGKAKLEKEKIEREEKAKKEREKIEREEKAKLEKEKIEREEKAKKEKLKKGHGR